MIEARDALMASPMTFEALFRREWREIERSLAEAKARARS